MRTPRQQEIVSFLAVFLSILAALKFNQYLFFHFDTSPAVILMPTGIALAAIYIGGYRLWVPIASAWLIATLTSPAQPTFLFVVVATFAYTLQAVIGGHVLKRLNFLGTLGRTRCALILIAVALGVPAIAPGIIAGVQLLIGSPFTTLWAPWSRAWAGGVMSIMIFTPFITTWFRDRSRKTPQQLFETIAALIALALAVYIVFWSTLAQANAFIVLYLLFGVLFWIGLRLHPRIVATALFLVAALGMTGSIIAHHGTTTIAQQLLSDELFLILIAPIFFILTALVEERRTSERDAQVRAEQLEEANHRLSQEDQTKNEFLTTLAHELRNPLAPVISSLELMKIKAAELNRPDLTELIGVAEVHNRTLIQLLDDLLDISRITRNRYTLHKESVELRRVVEQAIGSVDGLFKSRGHLLSVSIPKENLWIEVDPLRLEQIMVNLLNNAAKYTNPRGFIELNVVHDEQRGLRISVKDNGIGIESNMLTKIFEPYVQSNDGSAGLGIGLSLTRRLVELHGGEVWAESEGLGKGSEFVVVLTEVQSVRPPLPSTTSRRCNDFSAKPHKPVGTHQILIVDDNNAAADGLKKLLEHNGHTVAVAHDGPEALEKMRDSKARVVLLDIGLPGMDGYVVAKNLRQEYSHNPPVLVALTGYGQEEDKAKAREAGFNYHLTKPVSIADVQAILVKETLSVSPRGRQLQS